MREFAVLERIFEGNAGLPADVVVPPGDDMAAIRIGAGAASTPVCVLAATDSVIEGRHTPMGIDPFVIGRKAVLRNISDVAAMGNARPIATLAAVVLPAGMDEHAVWRLYEGLRETAEAWSAPLVGGDISSSESPSRKGGEDGRPPIIAMVTVLAVPVDPSHPVVLRSNARPGDRVFVTGTIGSGWDRTTGLGRHLDFTPRLAVGQQLARMLGPSLGAMIDISDGLGRDLGHIARRSGVRIEIDPARVPTDARGHGAPDDTQARLEAMSLGEDYELAFTVRADAADGVPSIIDGVPVTEIGRVLSGPASAVARSGEATFDLTSRGFEHGGGGVAR
ncbi:MAG: putative thiamine-monophosphate kinase [Planctomycetota bacterium]